MKNINLNRAIFILKIFGGHLSKSAVRDVKQKSCEP